MKRRPPPGNMRRVRHINGNSRSTFITKTGRVIQSESFNEFKLILLLERDPTVADYNSQPDRIVFVDHTRRKRTYTPDFWVLRTNGQNEIHEVTLASRKADRASLVEREEVAAHIYATRGWLFVAHTDETLPAGAELANLEVLLGYKYTAYANADIQAEITALLTTSGRMPAHDLINVVAWRLDQPEPTVTATLLHLLWHNVITTDWQRLIIVDGDITRRTYIWIDEE